MRFSSIRKRAAAIIVTMIAAVALPLAAQAPAQAASNDTAGVTAWTPEIYPLFSGESVERDVSSLTRNIKLDYCAARNGIACVSVGQGDGKHSIFQLYKCDTRSLSNFIDALAVVNHQTGGAQVHFWGPRYETYIPADNTRHEVANHETYDFDRLDLC
ncbi:hypothetical protein [Streptomyces caniscabiei]|uniref:Secreted protein n=1 Tax=Streptomyces caniscabiei TaxID=2746961 RepID=A0ABU4ML80_9ACTN|nr:hypothetical protein [Streptomyces caniscabiei]MBE4738594.1 hypothetical protein [Streptomyces caniscabiei]MBE4756609.1 hypothetical protein [Streptomyces caniscabiei]MBE4768886.1 hypothetical protein [Streptomyces caniscabiei]MBE4782980.1 hypothetical protein [Streptomyces caniscabiei]MBE4792284.1 hypothetical protein [Streptomyces caniscabiei]